MEPEDPDNKQDFVPLGPIVPVPERKIPVPEKPFILKYLQLLIDVVKKPGRAFSEIKSDPLPRVLIPIALLFFIFDFIFIKFITYPMYLTFKIPILGSTLTLGGVEPKYSLQFIACVYGFVLVLYPPMLHAVSKLLGGKEVLKKTAAGFYLLAPVLFVVHVALSLVLQQFLMGIIFLLLLLFLWVFCLEIIKLKIIQDFTTSRAAVAVGSTVVLFCFAVLLLQAGLVFRLVQVKQAEFVNAVASISRPVVPQRVPKGEVNAAEIYTEAAKKIVKPTKEEMRQIRKLISIEWSAEHAKQLKIIDKNQAALDIFRKAGNIRYCDFTVGKYKSIKPTDIIPYPLGVNILAQLNILDGRYYANKGQWQYAVENYLSVLALANHYSQQKNFILEASLFKNLLLNILFEPISGLIHKRQVSPKYYRKLRNALLRIPTASSGISNGISEQVEQALLPSRIKMDILMVPFSEALGTRLRNEYVDLQKSRNYVQGRAAKENRPEQINLFDKKIKLQVLKIKLLEEPYAKFTCLLYPDKFAACQMTHFTGQDLDYTGMITYTYIAEVRRNILATALAVRLYEQEKQQSPQSLAALMPKYLVRLPTDSFDHFTPIKYIYRGNGDWSIYSIGPDRYDDNAESVITSEDIRLNSGKTLLRGDLVLKSRP